MRPARFEFIAGHLALDFVNTVDWRADSSRRQELLVAFEDLLAWAAAARLLRPREVRAMAMAAQRDRRRAERSLRRARRLREVLARMLPASAAAAPPAARDLRLFNAFLAAALRRRRLQLRGTAFAWTWEIGAKDVFDSLSWPVVIAAAELLTSEHRSRIHACCGDGCGWLFLDTSRNRRRRWCSMRSCGNRAKARRFYHRTHSAAASS